MNFSSEKIQDGVIHNLAEGILVIDFDGTIIYVNPAGCSILGVDQETLTGCKFAAAFLDEPENDAFAQTVVDAIYARENHIDRIIPYKTGGKMKKLHIVTSFFRDNEGQPGGITMVFGDLSELMELQDSLEAMEQINELNRQLNARNALLSKTFGQFLSDEIVKELVGRPGGPSLGGVKKSVTVMMSDLRGFTALSERMDAGDLISMLNHYLGKMTEIIQARSGTIIEFIGDGILAIFGAPIASRDHASLAVAAALEMEKAMDEINRWNAQYKYPHLEMGIGIDSGEVIVGTIGSEKRMKYGVVGKHVNLCGRIESYCVGGQILISPDVRAQLCAPVEIEREMTVSPKGAEQGIVLSHVTGLGEPYNIHIDVQSDTLVRVEHPIAVAFNRLNEKHTMEKYYFGGLIAVGRDSALLETESALELFDNIKLEAGGALFGKVTEKTDNVYFLQYTSIPSGYEKWTREALARSGSGQIPW